MRLRTRSRACPDRRAWADVVWPLLTGSLMAIGVLGAMSTYGIAGLVGVYVLLWGFAVGMLLSLGGELGMRHVSVVRVSLTAALGVVVALGLCHYLGAYGLLAVTLAAATSPTAASLIARRRPRRDGRATRPSALRMRLDQGMMDREFVEIAALAEKTDRPPGV